VPSSQPRVLRRGPPVDGTATTSNMPQSSAGGSVEMASTADAEGSVCEELCARFTRILCTVVRRLLPFTFLCRL
jgi:hypothetical protein